MKDKIFVTGATGKVGAEVVDQLLRRGVAVKAGARNPDKARARFGDAVEYVSFDYQEPARLAKALEDVNRLFLVLPGIGAAKKIINPGLALAKEAGIEHIVFLSMRGAEARSRAPHRKIEDAISASGIPYTFLRADFFMQNHNDQHCEEIRDRSEIFAPGGAAKRNFIDVRDIAEIAGKAFTEDGHRQRAYGLAGNQSIDLFEIAAIFTAVLGRTITYRNPSILQYVRGMRSRGVLFSRIAVIIFVYSQARFRSLDQYPNQTAEILGRPPVPFRQYVEDYKAYWR